MRITVDVPDRLAWRLATIAEARGTNVAALALQTLVLLGQATDADDTLHPVYMQWAAGAADREIAEALGWTNYAVAAKRRDLGLTANRKPR